MIIFNGTKTVGTQSFLIFKNESSSVIEVPVADNILSLFLHYFNVLSPGIKEVERTKEQDIPKNPV
jgi:hypothetical protein